MFLRILTKSISKRKGKIAIAVIAVMMGASVTTALLTVSLDVNEKMNYEFRKFGANLLLLPQSDTISVGIGQFGFGAVTEQKYINQSDLYKIKTIYWAKNVLGYAPFLYQAVTLENGNETSVAILTGTWFEKDTILEDGTVFKTGAKKINTWWEVQGDWVADGNNSHDAMIGVSVAERLGLGLGDVVKAGYSERPEDIGNATSIDLNVVGIVSTGGSEDDQVFVGLDVAQNLTGKTGKVHTVQVSALCTKCPVEEFAAEIEEKIPYVDAKTVKQLANAEMSLLSKIENMMLLVSSVALSASALGVATTMTASVVERRKEIGLMKAMGAENGRIASLFLAEAGIMGIVGGILGYTVGLVLAYFIGLSVFDSQVMPSLLVFPVALGTGVGVALLASLLPVRRATKVEPAVVLRGD
ncbi:MAG: FtsX-like permease family protein [Candidatus Thermoplasmatota archaeon]|nr:FtsX-like permease family protein [Candidatus Thermoplasmatota archaeon]MBU1913609.1 FtsX-like permease family protein [Candidatus Thermoplasmatota archaeon]